MAQQLPLVDTADFFFKTLSSVVYLSTLTLAQHNEPMQKTE